MEFMTDPTYQSECLLFTLPFSFLGKDVDEYKKHLMDMLYFNNNQCPTKWWVYQWFLWCFFESYVLRIGGESLDKRLNCGVIFQKGNGITTCSTLAFHRANIDWFLITHVSLQTLPKLSQSAELEVRLEHCQGRPQTKIHTRLICDLFNAEQAKSITK